MSEQLTKPYIYPRLIKQDGEIYEFSASKPGWLVYENDEHFILVGREESFDLEWVPPRGELDGS